MIYVLIGTRAQLIKMAPIVCEIERRGLRMSLILTGQHKDTIESLLRDFGVSTPPVWLHTGREISGLGQVLPWFGRCLWKLISRTSPLLDRNVAASKNVVLVHGDTFSTLLGAMAARIKKIKVGHVESGLRSFNLFHPFPEELTRLAVFRMTDIAFCPDNWSLSNLQGYRMKTINTQGNTLLDGLRSALKLRRFPANPMPSGKFGVVSIHRFENIFFKKRLAYILELLEEVAKKYPLVFVLHPATRRNLERNGHMEKLKENPKIHLWSRMSYFDFVTLIDSSAFVVTDGGSNQEELSYLGKPTLLMRQATERQDGLGANVMLSGYDSSKVRHFIDTIQELACDASPIDSMPSPSAVIVDALLEFEER